MLEGARCGEGRIGEGCRGSGWETVVSEPEPGGGMKLTPGREEVLRFEEGSVAP